MPLDFRVSLTPSLHGASRISTTLLGYPPRHRLRRASRRSVPVKSQVSRLCFFVATVTFGFVGCGGAPSGADAVKLQGAGASFPAPLYNKWFKSYNQAHQDVTVDYQS